MNYTTLNLIGGTKDLFFNEQMISSILETSFSQYLVSQTCDVTEADIETTQVATNIHFVFEAEEPEITLDTEASIFDDFGFSISKDKHWVGDYSLNAPYYSYEKASIAEVRPVPSYDAMHMKPIPPAQQEHYKGKFIRANMTRTFMCLNTWTHICSDFFGPSGVGILTDVLLRVPLQNVLASAKELFNVLFSKRGAVSNGNVLLPLTELAVTPVTGWSERATLCEFFAFPLRLSLESIPGKEDADMKAFLLRNLACGRACLRRKCGPEELDFDTLLKEALSILLPKEPAIRSKYQLGPFYYGPGATIPVSKNGGKYPRDLWATKWLEVFPSFGAAFPGCESAWLGSYERVKPVLTPIDATNLSAECRDGIYYYTPQPLYNRDFTPEVIPAVVNSVAKDFSSCRIITQMSTMHAHYGFKVDREALEPVIREAPFFAQTINSFDQSRQAGLMLKCKNLVGTTDFSAASDTLGDEFYKTLWPVSWYKLMHSVRPTHYIVNGKKHKAYIFGPMGAGCTFNGMQMSLAVAASVGCVIAYSQSSDSQKENIRTLYNLPDDYDLLTYRSKLMLWARYIGAVGDDLISPTFALDCVWEYLATWGMKVNHAKSFRTAGDTAESCGTYIIEGKAYRFVRFSRNSSSVETVDSDQLPTGAYPPEFVGELVSLQHDLYGISTSASRFLASCYDRNLGSRQATRSVAGENSSDPWESAEVGVSLSRRRGPNGFEPLTAPVGDLYTPNDSQYTDDTGLVPVQRDAAARLGHWLPAARVSRPDTRLYTPVQLQVLEQALYQLYLRDGATKVSSYEGDPNHADATYPTLRFIGRTKDLEVDSWQSLLDSRISTTTWSWSLDK